MMGARIPRSRLPRGWMRSGSLAMVGVLIALVLGAGAPTAYAAATVGYRGPSIAGASTAPSGSKPESKLWWNDGFWWGSLWHTASGDYHIFRLDLASQTWIDTGTVLDTRSNSRADVLWDGTKLYVASHVYTTSSGPTSSSNAAKLWRFSYDPTQNTYHLDAGFPVNINAARSETLVIEKDSTGQLWATWVQQTTSTSGVYKVYVSHTTGSDATWGPALELPVADTAVAKDDISSVIAFGGNRIGVMWSNQAKSAMYFAVHNDVDGDQIWQGSRTALQGPKNADDHINLKSLQADAQGRVFAVIKTSHSTSAAPLIMLLVRDTAGNWSSAVHSRVVDDQTRPIVLLDKDRNTLYVYASDESGGAVYEKFTSISSGAFTSGKGTVFVQDGSSAELNNATSTKQSVTCETGIVVLATNDTTDYYWHNYRTLPGCDGPPPGDTTAPTVAVTAPAAGTTVAGSAVALAADASDNVGVTGVQFQLDGANLGPEATNGPFTITWDSTTVGNGSHTVTAVARDAAGNAATALPVVISVANPTTDPTPPSVTLTAPSSGATVSGSVAVTANASDDVAVAGVQFRLDGAALGAEDTAAPFSVPWDTTSSTNGDHSLVAVARDRAGNATTSSAVTVTVSNSTSGAPIAAMTFEDGCLTGCPSGASSQVGTVQLVSGADALRGRFSATVPGTGNSYLERKFAGADDFYISFLLELHALPGGDVRIPLISNAGTSIGNLVIRKDGTLVLRNGSTAIGAAATKLSAGTVYRLGVHQQRGSGGNAVLEGFIASAADGYAFGAPFAALRNGTWMSPADRIRIGATTSTALNATIDDVTLDAARMP